MEPDEDFQYLILECLPGDAVEMVLLTDVEQHSGSNLYV